MAKRSDKFDVRVTADLGLAIRKEAKARGYASPSAFIRTGMEHEIAGRDTEMLSGTEERLVATIEQVRGELFRLGRAQQALFAYLDSLAKVLLTCIPEPPQGAREQAIARARERHSRLVKTAGSSMVGDSQAAMQDLVGHDEN